MDRPSDEGRPITLGRSAYRALGAAKHDATKLSKPAHPSNEWIARLPGTLKITQQCVAVVWSHRNLAIRPTRFTASTFLCQKRTNGRDHIRVAAQMFGLREAVTLTIAGTGARGIAQMNKMNAMAKPGDERHRVELFCNTQ